MELLRRLFRPKSEVWRGICDQLGGRYVDGGFWARDVVEFEYKGIPLKLTAESDTENPGYYLTFLRTPIHTECAFMLGILQNWPGQTAFRLLIQLFGLQRIAMPRAGTGMDVIVLTNEEARAKSLLEDPDLQNLILGQSQLMLFVGRFPKFSTTGRAKGPQVVVSAPGVIEDTERLQKLLQLQETMLERLLAAGVASAN